MVLRRAYRHPDIEAIEQRAFLCNDAQELKEGGGGGGGRGWGWGWGRAAEETDLEIVVRALLGDHVLNEMSSFRVAEAGPVCAVEWVSWAVMWYTQLVFSHKLLDVATQLRKIFSNMLTDALLRGRIAAPDALDSTTRLDVGSAGKDGGGGGGGGRRGAVTVAPQALRDISSVSVRWGGRGGAGSGAGAGSGEGGGGKHDTELLLPCSVCRLPVRGLLTTCSKCGHGGHLHHLKFW